MSESVLNRFLKYVRYDTQSVRESDTEPSSAKELVLAEELVRELKDLGITDARIGKGGVVYATIPATKGCEECPAVGFIAHMDTSPDASGTDVKSQILRFTGDDVLLNAEKNIVFPVKNFPEIAKYKGEDIVFTGRLTINNYKACRSLSNFPTSISTSIHRKLIESIQMSRAPSSA